MSNILIEDLLKIKGQINIIDIRGIEKYNNGHIDNAINIPNDNILINTDKYLNKNDTYYIYCQRGIKSVSVCKTLRNKGYKVMNILGGYQSWILLK